MNQYIPSQQNHRAKKTATAFFFCSLVLFLVSGIQIVPYRSVIQLISFSLMTVAILICVRFLFRSYCYRLESGEQGVDFVVLELSKRGAVTVCRLSSNALLSVERLTHELAAEKKKTKGIKIYNYCVDIAPNNALLLCFSDSTYSPSDTPVCLKIQSDEAFENALRAFVPHQEKP